jgi:hypothetical protein
MEMKRKICLVFTSSLPLFYLTFYYLNIFLLPFQKKEKKDRHKWLYNLMD